MFISILPILDLTQTFSHEKKARVNHIVSRKIACKSVFFRSDEPRFSKNALKESLIVLWNVLDPDQPIFSPPFFEKLSPIFTNDSPTQHWLVQRPVLSIDRPTKWASQQSSVTTQKQSTVLARISVLFLSPYYLLLSIFTAETHGKVCFLLAYFSIKNRTLVCLTMYSLSKRILSCVFFLTVTSVAIAVSLLLIASCYLLKFI